MSDLANMTESLPPWIISRIFVLELLVEGMTTLYLSSLRSVPTAEEASARLEAFRSSGLAGVALLPEEIRSETASYLAMVLDRVEKGVEGGRAAILQADAAFSATMQ